MRNIETWRIHRLALPTRRVSIGEELENPRVRARVRPYKAAIASL